MRHAIRMILFAGCLIWPAGLMIAADPRPGPGYSIEIVHVPGAMLCGIAADGDDLLLSNLADGRLYRRSPDGSMRAFGPVLPHGLDVIGDPTGPYRVQRLGGTYLVAQGWTPAASAESPYDHALLEVDETTVRRVVHGDFWNPFDFLVDDATLVVIDAARNSVERVSLQGDKTTLFTFPRLAHQQETLKTLSPTAFAGRAPYEVDAVPTGIASHDGRLFVSLFGGFPYLSGGGAIVSLDPHGDNAKARPELEGLQAPVDLAFDGRGQLLVLEHGRFTQSDGFLAGSGRLLRADRRAGDPSVVVDGLTRPTTLALLHDGRIAIAALDGTLVLATETAAAPQPRQ